MSDRHFVHSTRVFADLYAKHVPVYLYNFTQMVPVKDDEKSRRVPSHDDETTYMFEVSGEFAQMLATIGKGHEDEQFSREVVATWVAFAATGKPNGPWVDWPAYNEHGTSPKKWMHIEKGAKVEPIPDSWEVSDKFWKGLNIKELGGTWKSDEA